MSHFNRMDNLPVTAMAIFEPSGNHCLEIMLGGSPASLMLGRQQVRDLRKAIDAFEREAAFEDGGPDRLHRRRKPLDFGGA